MTHITDNELAPVADVPLEPTELLIPEVRYRTRRRRLRNLGVIIVVALGVSTYIIVSSGGKAPTPRQTTGNTSSSGQTTTDAAINGPVATSVQVLASGRGTLKSWYSSSGTTDVQEVISPTGVVTSIERDVYAVHDGRFGDTHTVLFPVQRDWATESTSSACETTCYADAYEYPSPSLIRRLLADHELKIVGAPTTIDGRTVGKIVSVPATPGALNTGPQTQGWVDPRNDEVVRFSGDGPTVTTYTWLPGTPANLAHLDLTIPAGYSQVAGTYAAGLTPTPPPTNPSYQSLLVTCATQSSNLPPPPESTVFTSVKSGTTDGIPWALWFAVQRGDIIFAMMSGVGGNAQCINGDGEGTNVAQPSSELGVGQLPGQPVAFVFGVVNDSAITSAEATAVNVNANVALTPLRGSMSSSRYAFAEIRGLDCANLDSAGFSYSDSVFEGTKIVGSNSGGGGASSDASCRT